MNDHLWHGMRVMLTLGIWRCSDDLRCDRNSFRTTDIRMMFDAPASRWSIVPRQALGRALFDQTSGPFVSPRTAPCRSPGLKNVHFEESDLAVFATDEKFDALVGRFVLLYVPDPATVLRSLSRHLRPNAIIALQERYVAEFSGARIRPVHASATMDSRGSRRLCSAIIDAAADRSVMRFVRKRCGMIGGC